MNKTITIVVDIPEEQYERVKNIINLGDLLEKAVLDRLLKLIES